MTRHVLVSRLALQVFNFDKDPRMAQQTEGAMWIKT